MLPFFLTRGDDAALRPSELDDALFARALDEVLRLEGGFTDDPHDPGGPTNLGITLAEFARHRRQPLDDQTYAALKRALREITRAEAAGIYRTDYWQAARCPLLPAALAVFHFDAAVNQGVRGAARMLQRALAVSIDGSIGPATLGAARAHPPSQILPRYADARRAHYRSLSTFWRFGRGWLARVDRTLAFATAIAADPRFNPPQTKETPAMTDTPIDTKTTSGPAVPKWWGQSMTMWGVAITTLSTVLPVIGPLLGFNITADLVQQLGDGLVQVVQAAGGLIGTALTVWGRLRASQPLSRTQVTLTL